MLDINEVCNQTCNFCEGRIDFLKSKRKGRYWDLEQLKNIMPRLSGEAYLSFAGSMGEPLLNKDFPEILKEIKKSNKNIMVQVFSNGLSLNHKLCSKVIDYVDVFRFSIHAATKETHNKLIQNSDFDKIKSNLEYLQSIKPKSLTTIMGFVGMKENIHEFPQFVRWAYSLGMNEVILQILSERGHEFFKGQSLVRYPELLRAKWKEALATEEANTNMKVKILDAYKAVIENRGATVEEIAGVDGLAKCQSSESRNLPRKDETRDCLVPFLFTLPVSFDGRVVPCCSRTIKNDEYFGNIFDGDPTPIRHTKYFINLRKALLTGKLPYYYFHCCRMPKNKIEKYQKIVHEWYEKLSGSNQTN